MDCRQIKSQFASLSADDLQETAAFTLHRHLDECPECRHEWMLVQNTLLVLSTASQPLPSAARTEQMWRECAKCVHDRIEEKRLAAQQPPFLGWIKAQPRWGWAALGTAIVVFGGAWILAPQDNAAPAPIFASAAQTDSADPGQLVTFREPPRDVEMVVNHHSAMAVDPFADHVGSNLVSYTASAP